MALPYLDEVILSLPGPVGESNVPRAKRLPKKRAA